MENMQDPTALYLDLLKKSLLEDLYVENELRLLYLRQCLEAQDEFQPEVFLDIRRRKPKMFQEYIELREVGINYGRTLKNLGFQHTMIGRRRLENVESSLETVLQERIPGDVMECGVWRGGAVIFMRGFLAAKQEATRSVWVADSFEGLPVPTTRQDAGLDLSAARFPMLAIDEETVRNLFERYGLLDERVRFLKGWFKDTLLKAPIAALSLLRLDGDLYESTMDALNALYDRVSPGGFVIIDDFGVLVQCKQAVMDFRGKHNISSPIHQVDWSGVYWRKGA
jgi:hypothetical protein